MGLGPTAMAAVSAEAAKVGIGPFVINAQAPDEGNQHTLEHWGTPEQKDKYLRPLCEGTARSCFAMTEPEVAGSDPTLIQTFAYRDGDEWIVNGHKWFISGGQGRSSPSSSRGPRRTGDPPGGQHRLHRRSAQPGLDRRPGHRHDERLAQPLRDRHRGPAGAPRQHAGRPGSGPPARPVGLTRLAHCMRWIGQAEIALDMTVKRALERYSHGSYLAEKQGIQWLIARPWRCTSAS